MARKNQKAPWEEEEEIILVSKTEMKNDMIALQKLGEELVKLKDSVLNTFPLPEELVTAIKDAQRFKNEARRRQLQYIGRVMRTIDAEPIQLALDKHKSRHSQLTAVFHKLEVVRDDIIEQGDSAINTLLEEYPDADRQKLRQLARQAKKEKEQNKPPKSAREIFQMIRSLYEEKHLG